MRIFWKLSVAVMASLFLLGTAYAMIQTLPVDDLVRKADYIVIAYVHAVTTEGAPPYKSKIINLRNELRLIESLKGRWPSQDPIILTTNCLIENVTEGVDKKGTLTHNLKVTRKPMLRKKDSEMEVCSLQDRLVRLLIA